MRAPCGNFFIPQERPCFKPLGVGDGARTQSQTTILAAALAVSNPSEWGTVRTPPWERTNPRRRPMFQTPRSGGRCAHRQRKLAKQLSPDKFQTPRSGGRCAHPRRRQSIRRNRSQFQTPRSGGRCAHRIPERSNTSSSICFKPLGVGDGARTVRVGDSGGRRISVSNPSEWGTVRAPSAASPSDRPTSRFKPLGVGDGARTRSELSGPDIC